VLVRLGGITHGVVVAAAPFARRVYKVDGCPAGLIYKIGVRAEDFMDEDVHVVEEGGGTELVFAKLYSSPLHPREARVQGSVGVGAGPVSRREKGGKRVWVGSHVRHQRSSHVHVVRAAVGAKKVAKGPRHAVAVAAGPSPKQSSGSEAPGEIE
jgi:hypothetical protein